MAEKKTLLFRVDGHPSIGAGHVMRCLALAQQWQDRGGGCLFAMQLEPGTLAERIAQEGFGVVRLETHEVGSAGDMMATLALAEKTAAEWVVLDGYRFTAECQKQIGGAGFRLLCIDDLASEPTYYADLILNQNINARPEMYPESKRKSGSRLLLGLEYCLLNRAFLSIPPAQRQAAAQPPAIFVALGAGDQNGMTGKTLETIGRLGAPYPEVRVAVSSLNPYLGEITALVPRLPFACEMIVDASSRQMAQAMRRSTLAVLSAGGTLWEALYLRRCVLSYTLNAVQREIIALLEKTGAVDDLGDVSEDFSLTGERLLRLLCQRLAAPRPAAIPCAIASRQVADFL